ncbi:MAG: SDR family NAD(P)-dependent oxidoreductase [Rhodomicrobium sp.]
MRGVLITGAAKRIGAHVAKGLAKEQWHVILHYWTSQDSAEALASEINGQGGAVTLLRADLTKDEDCAQLICAAFEACPGMEALINNASIFEYDSFKDVTPSNLRKSLQLNGAVPILLTKEFSEKYAGNAGCVINMLDNKVFGLNPDYFSYTVGKYALFGATSMMAMALMPRIRVAGIAPGITLVSGKQSEANFAAGHKMNPLGVGCTPDQILDAVKFILGARSYNGQVITIDGGESLNPHGRDVAFLNPE